MKTAMPVSLSPSSLPAFGYAQATGERDNDSLREVPN
jgi:hypothetical protein